MFESNASNAVPSPFDPPGVPEALRYPEPPSAPEPPGAPSAPAAPEAPRPSIDDEREKISDPAMMRALSHPARMMVFDFLGSRKAAGEDGATATEIAEAAGMTPSAMSYHLRTLAKAGFIEEAPSRGDARERVWRLAISNFSIQAEPDAPESHHLAEQAMLEAFMESQDRRSRRWHQIRRELDSDAELYTAQTFSQGGGLLTPAEARECIERIYEVVNDYVERTRRRAEGEEPIPEDAVNYFYVLRMFPEL